MSSPPDRHGLGDGLDPATRAELDELALARAAATGQPVLVLAFTGADRATILDLDELGGRAVVAGVVLLLKPSPPLAPGVEPEPEAPAP